MKAKEIAEKIENAIEGATAGPWEVYVETVPSRYDAAYELAEQIQGTDPFVGKLFMLTANGKCPAETGCGPTSEGNANYLVACNPANMRAILADYKRQSELLEEARKVLPIIQKDAADKRIASVIDLARDLLVKLEVQP